MHLLYQGHGVCFLRSLLCLQRLQRLSTLRQVCRLKLCKGMLSPQRIQHLRRRGLHNMCTPAKCWWVQEPQGMRRA